MYRTRLVVAIVLSVSSVASAAPVSAQSTRPFPLPMAAEVHFSPSAINAAGTHHFIYEIHLTSYLPSTAILTRVEVFAESRHGPSLLVYEGPELVANMGPLGGSLGARAGKETAAVQAWSHAMVYMAVPVGMGGQALPRKLHQVLTFDVEGSNGGFSDVVDVSTEVLPRTETVEIGPPLKGGPWVARNGPGNEAGHRRAVLPTNGRPGLAQRYAIDYMKLDASGRFFSGDSTKNESYAGDGQEVIAVADAIVSTAYDGVPENTPYVTRRPDVFNITTAIGNHVILDLGDGRYVLYAHLKSGSVRVNEGDYVRRGQVLGLLGNTGNSGGPHLHFHLVDRNSPLGAEGLPYTHNAFEWLGKCVRRSGSDACTIGAAERRVGQTPMQDDILRFPD